MSSENISASIITLISLAIALVCIIGMWKMFTKAGKPGWAVLIPFYNLYVILKMAGKPGWWVILYLVPIVNTVIHLLVSLSLAKTFGKGNAFGIIALWLFGGIGYIILGFDKSVYTPPTSQTPMPASVPEAPVNQNPASTVPTETPKA